MSMVFIPATPLHTPVLFLVFNRPETTKRVFEAIRKAKPSKLYIAADGPRENKNGEIELVKLVRKIVSNIDWPCEVKTLFRNENLGCKYAVSNAITWFFENEEQGIILEDDCLPSMSFFWYCQELLEKYKQEENIYVISGDARGPEAIGMNEDYGFCKYSLIWGWATWRRVWKKYDVDLKTWPATKNELIEKVSDYGPTKAFWRKVFEDLYLGKINTWDYQLTYLLLINSAKCIVPKVNLVSNIGFGHSATHTFDINSTSANRPTENIQLPLKDNTLSQSELAINRFFDKTEFRRLALIKRILKKLDKIFL